MSKRMLVDGAHAEETRIVVMSEDQLAEYDFETTTKKQIKGNIYLAKVMRVEPSLQAAFVEFGGNRHGFLALSDIHPDYYQIPIEDRQKLMEQQAVLELEARAAREHLEDLDGETSSDEIEEEEDRPKTRKARSSAEQEESPEDDDPSDESAPDEPPPPLLSRQYKIQEVIKRRQIMLVQVVKEERGNKGAALTTYISLAGRCCVLMPNASRGGGISRRITNVKERRKLREILSSLDIADGIGVIIRTAGRDRSKAEIRRDFEYLLKVWDQIRQTTLESTAPCLIHEEADIIKRAIRDVYSRDVTEILVEGTDAYRRAKGFMRLMMPSHAKRVQPYRDENTSLFQQFRIEEQLDAMYSPEVALKSGGSLVINQTEALVAIDVNSGQSTRERNIERTALKTNIEAADEAARQLRLRDLAGLIVIDFIDMEENRNVRKVERRFRDALKADRARTQVGQISEFGLLEMSRQRLRPSLIEASSQTCQLCRGTGIVLSTEAMALRVLRTIEKEGSAAPDSEIAVHVPSAVALYILNYKRRVLDEIETRHGLATVLHADDSIMAADITVQPAGITRSRGGDADSDRKPQHSTPSQQDEEPKPARRRRTRRKAASDNPPAPAESRTATTPGADAADEAESESTGKRRRRTRRRRGGEEQAPVAAAPTGEVETAEGAATSEETGRRKRRRRRSRSTGERAERPRDATAPDESGSDQASDERVTVEDNEPGAPISAEPASEEAAAATLPESGEGESGDYSASATESEIQDSGNTATEAAMPGADQQIAGEAVTGLEVPASRHDIPSDAAEQMAPPHTDEAGSQQDPITSDIAAVPGNGSGGAGVDAIEEDPERETGEIRLPIDQGPGDVATGNGSGSATTETGAPDRIDGEEDSVSASLSVAEPDAGTAEVDGTGYPENLPPERPDDAPVVPLPAPQSRNKRSGWWQKSAE